MTIYGADVVGAEVDAPKWDARTRSRASGPKPERMASVWLLLYASYKGIVEDDSGNAYSHHTSSRKAHNVSAKAGDNHDRRFPVGKIVAAEATLEVLTCADGSEGEIDRGKSSSSSDEDE